MTRKDILLVMCLSFCVDCAIVWNSDKAMGKAFLNAATAMAAEHMEAIIHIDQETAHIRGQIDGYHEAEIVRFRY